MDSRYSYDENNEVWPIFTLALVSVAVLPVTVGSIVSFFNKSDDEVSSNNAIDQSSYVPSNIKTYRAKLKRKAWINKKSLFLLAGWLIIAGLLNHIANTEYKLATNSFDPYDILGIEYGSSEKEVKSQFRKLSIKFHPDKVSYSNDEEKLAGEEHFVLISKAYKALTDDETRENYEKYGHPDGPQTVTHGIALPKWLIEGGASPVLLVLYIVLIGLILPVIVSRWWNQTKSLTKKGIHNETAELFVDKLLEYKPSEIVRVSNVLDWLSDSVELRKYGDKDYILGVFDKHFGRLGLTELELEIIGKIPLLINGLIDISTSFRNTEITTVVIETQKLFIQALKENPYNELLQLPHVDKNSVTKSNIIRLSKLLTLPKSEIQAILGIKDEKKLEETLRVASSIPILKLVKAEFKIPGEKVITPSSNGYVSLKVLVKSPNHHGSFKIDDSKLVEDESMENLRDPYKIVKEQPRLPTTFAPYFPLEKISNYAGLVVIQKDSKIAQTPDFFTNLSLDNLKLTQEQYKKGDDLVVGTIKIPFQVPTPATVGNFEFRVILKSMDYFVQDIDTTIVMKVEEPPRLEEVDYDIPELQKDSLAGAMAELKGEYGSDDEDDDEDDSEVEQEDFTDIDTETEDEF